jgi:DNA-binding IclR family transcriptional regulator
MLAGARPGRSGAAERKLVDRKFVTALARGLDVLRCFGPRDRWLANQEIARRTGLAKPTVTRLAYTLIQLGHLRYSTSLNKYALGSAALSLGYAALAQMDVRRIARPLMQSLSEHIGAAVHLSVRDRLSMILIDTYRATASFIVEIGSRVPIANTSIGRAWVSALPADERRPILDELRASRPEDWTHLRKAFEQAFREHEEHGYCLGVGEWRREVNGIAVPLALADGADPVVFSCSGAAFQLTPEVLKKDIAPRLLTLVGNVRSALASE